MKHFRQLETLLDLMNRLSKGRLSAKAVIALTVVAALYLFVVQPVVESRFGVSLPSIAEKEAEPKDNRAQQRAERPSAPDAARTQDAAFTPSDLSGLLEGERRGAYRSPAGLLYTKGSQQGHRLSHLMTHARDLPNRDGRHGVFDSEEPSAIVELVDEAYRQALSGEATDREVEGQRVVYTVDLGRRIGYVGGRSGARKGNPPASHMRLVVQEDRLITAFPLRP